MEAELWCHTTDCPSEVTLATEVNCCIHHVNVHSCPVALVRNGLCGPWIPPEGSIFTHSQVAKLHVVQISLCFQTPKYTTNSRISLTFLSFFFLFCNVKVLVGSAKRKNWTSYVEGLHSEGHVSLIAHLKVARMHLALETTIRVTPQLGK